MLHRPWPGMQALTPFLANSLTKRSEGLHVSELYNLLHPQKVRTENPISDEELAVYAIAGFSLEMVLEEGFKQLVSARCEHMGLDVERPGELVSSEGIKCSPDLYFYEPDGDIIIGDMKCKWKSTKGIPSREEGEDDFPEWCDKHFSQLMAYLHVLSEQVGRSFTKGRLIVYFVNGDYKGMKPQLHGWDLEWSEREIEENWDALMTIARGRRK